MINGFGEVDGDFDKIRSKFDFRIVFILFGIIMFCLNSVVMNFILMVLSIIIWFLIEWINF